MNIISTSIFDIFKIGPGPSSSHTIGPMRAAGAFLAAAEKLPPEALQRVHALKVYLYGSLSATGKGHGTDRAITAGLLGQHPETCDAEWINRLLTEPGQTYAVKIGKQEIPFRADNIIFADANDVLPFANTMRIDLIGNDGEKLLSKIYYSLGGGFIHCEGDAETERPRPPYQYANLRQFKHLVKRHELSPVEMLLANERAVSGLTDEEIFQRLDLIVAAMEKAVENGLQATGVLPGKIGLERKAADLFARAAGMVEVMDRNLLMLNAFAMAASEENAAGKIVVTAPTSGASGVLPGIIYLLKHHFHTGPQQLREGLLIAALIAFISKHNASISGAEVGCQGEVGVASAMAAALLAQVRGYPLNIAENAAESALEHHLGMTCDPIGGYVQIPCIERNAVGAVTAYNAYLLAAGGNPDKHKLSFDAVIEAMLETGRDMCPSYKETSRGGLASCSLCC